MKKMTVAVLLPVITASTLALFSLDSMANEKSRTPPTFSQMDANGDGVLTKDEVKGPLADDFDRIDADGSGDITEDELPAPPTGRK
ncbi:MAG: hypothetical protein ACTIM4_12900 [Marinomonas sp.]